MDPQDYVQGTDSIYAMMWKLQRQYLMYYNSLIDKHNAKLCEQTKSGLMPKTCKYQDDMKVTDANAKPNSADGSAHKTIILILA